MKRTIVAAVIILSLMLSASAFAATQCAKPGGGSGCYGTIQEAVDAASSGDTINVLEGTYNENVYISTPNLTIIGVVITTTRTRKGFVSVTQPAGPRKVIVDAHDGCYESTPEENAPQQMGAPGFEINAPNVTLKNMTVRHSCGVNIFSWYGNTTISDVRSINSESDSIVLLGSNQSVTKTIVMGARYSGLFVEGDAANIQNNTISNINNEPYGPEPPLQSEGSGAIAVWGANPTIVNNIIRNVENGNGIFVDADYYGAIINDNKIASISGYIGLYPSGDKSVNTLLRSVKTPEQMFMYGIGILVFDAYDLSVARNTIHSVNAGLILEDTYNSTVMQNTVSNATFVGIAFIEYDGYDSAAVTPTDDGMPNTITKNSVTGVGFEGYCLMGYSLVVTNNTAKDITAGDGFSIDTSSGTISGNTASYANGYGGETGFRIYAYGTSITGNTAEYNNGYGIDISGSYNTILSNTARYNGTYWWNSGIYVGGEYNTINNNISEENYGKGFEIYGDYENWLNGNVSRNNAVTGFALYGSNATFYFSGNNAQNNEGEGIANLSNLVDMMNNNNASGNRLDICNSGTINTFTSNIFTTGGSGTPCELEGI